MSNDPVAEALAWFSGHTTAGTPCVEDITYGLILSAEVRANAIESAHLREAFVTMERAYNAHEAQRCETCLHMRNDDHVGEPCCTISLTWIPCRALGGGCRGWQRREPESNATTAVPITEANRGTQIV